MKQALCLCFILLVIVNLCGCGAVEPEELIVRVLTSITIDPSSATFAKNSGSFKFIATGYDQFGSAMTINPSWSASAEVGTINSNGVLTVSLNIGTGEVRAYIGTIEGKSAVEVTDGTLDTITVSPSPVIVNLYGSQSFFTIGLDSLANEVDLDPFWYVETEDNIGIVGQDGSFTAIALGEGRVVASQAGVLGSAEVTVVE